MRGDLGAVKAQVTQVHEDVSEELKGIKHDLKGNGASNIGNASPTGIENVVSSLLDKEKCKLNVVIHNIKESDSMDRLTRIDYDKTSVLDIARTVGIMDMDICKTIRIGKKLEGNDRLLLVCTSNIAMKRELLAKAKRLKEIEELKKVFITPDLDEEERMKDKALTEELKKMES